MNFSLKQKLEKTGLRRKSLLFAVSRAILYFVLFDLAVVFLYPFFYMMITSVKSPADINDASVTWIINKFYFYNYSIAAKHLHYFSSLFRTVIYCVLSTAGHVFICSFVGYGFARYRFKGKRLFFLMLVFSMVIPIQTILIPQYLLYAKLGTPGGFVPLVLPTFFGYGLRGALFIFLFRQFYLSLPRSLEEAAAVDGCTPVMTFFRIAFPASSSSVVVTVVLSVVWHWNDFYEPGIYLTDSSEMLLPMLLPKVYTAMQQAQNSAEALISGVNADIFTSGVAMAATFLAVLPILIFYFFFQKRFRQGIERSGITGE